MEHVCANREHRKRATSWGIGIQAIHTDKMHYYLCTLINGERRLSINYVARGAERREGQAEWRKAEKARMWATWKLPALCSSDQKRKYELCSPFWACNIFSGGMVTPLLCVDATHWHKHTCTWACIIAAPTNKHSHKQWLNSSVSLSWSLIFRLLFPVARARPGALSSPLPGSDRVLEGVINSELWDLHPLTCGSFLYRLLLLPPHLLDISDHNVTAFSLCVAFLFVWTEPWPVVQFVGHLKIPNQW